MNEKTIHTNIYGKPVLAGFNFKPLIAVAWLTCKDGYFYSVIEKHVKKDIGRSFRD